MVDGAQGPYVLVVRYTRHALVTSDDGGHIMMGSTHVAPEEVFPVGDDAGNVDLHDPILHQLTQHVRGDKARIVAAQNEVADGCVLQRHFRRLNDGAWSNGRGHIFKLVHVTVAVRHVYKR